MAGLRGAGNRNVAIAEDEYEKKRHAELIEVPPHEAHVYLAGFSHNASEEDLRDFCCQFVGVGNVFKVRILGGHKCGRANVYAFVTFKTKEIASEVIEKLNKSIFQGNILTCSSTEEKHRRLFIGNIPNIWTEKQLREAVRKVGPGVNSVKLLKKPNNNRDRRSAFIEYYNHVCAAYSIMKMSDPNFKLDGIAPRVEWAKPNVQGNVVNVKNLPEKINRHRIEELFEQYGKIYKVVLPPVKAEYRNSRYCLVHFAESSSAKKVLEDTEKYEIDGQVLECSRPKTRGREKSSRTRAHKTQ